MISKNNDYQIDKLEKEIHKLKKQLRTERMNCKNSVIEIDRLKKIKWHQKLIGVN